MQQYLDPYQIEHAKNFRYRYYPPKLVELAPPADQETKEGNGSCPNNNGNNGNMGASYAPAPQKSNKVIWIIIITLILLSCFLVIGVLMTQPATGSSSSGGGRGR